MFFATAALMPAHMRKQRSAEAVFTSTPTGVHAVLHHARERLVQPGLLLQVVLVLAHARWPWDRSSPAPPADPATGARWTPRCAAIRRIAGIPPPRQFGGRIHRRARLAHHHVGKPAPKLISRITLHKKLLRLARSRAVANGKPPKRRACGSVLPPSFSPAPPSPCEGGGWVDHPRIQHACPWRPPPRPCSPCGCPDPAPAPPCRATGGCMSSGFKLSANTRMAASCARSVKSPRSSFSKEGAIRRL